MNSSDAAIKARKGQSSATKKVSQSAKAGLEFPVSKVATFLKKGNYSDRVSTGAPIYLTGVLEYLAAEVLELAGNEARNGNKKRINPRHLKLAVGGDDELKQLLHNVTIANAGVNPKLIMICHQRVLENQRIR